MQFGLVVKVIWKSSSFSLKINQIHLISWTVTVRFYFINGEEPIKGSLGMKNLKVLKIGVC